MFIYFVNEYLDREMSLEEAVAASVKRAKKEGILVDFLNKYATEVEGMLTGITVEKYGEVMKKEGFEDGKAAGIAQGEASGRAERERAFQYRNELFHPLLILHHSLQTESRPRRPDDRRSALPQSP